MAQNSVGDGLGDRLARCKQSMRMTCITLTRDDKESLLAYVVRYDVNGLLVPR